MLALRTSGIGELIVATAATALLAGARPARHPFAMPVAPIASAARVPVVDSERDEVDACWQLPPAAATAYVSHHFGEVAALLADTCSQSDGQLLQEMSSLWREADNGNLEERYDALVAARAIDVSFAGRLAGELDARLRTLVEPFAMQLVAQHRYEEAETVIEHGKLLGVDMHAAARRMPRN